MGEATGAVEGLGADVEGDGTAVRGVGRGSTHRGDVGKAAGVAAAGRSATGAGIGAGEAAGSSRGAREASAGRSGGTTASGVGAAEAGGEGGDFTADLAAASTFPLAIIARRYLAGPRAA